MRGIYFIIILAGVCLASIIGLISALLMLSPDAPMAEIYIYASKVAAIILIVGYPGFIILESLGYITIEKSIAKKEKK